MDWKNWPGWLKGALLFTLIGILISILALLSVGISNLIGIDTLMVKRIFLFFGLLTSFPLIFTVILLFAFISRSFFNSLPQLFFAYVISLFLIGAPVGWLFKKYKKGRTWIKGGLIGVSIAFAVSFIFLLWLFLWFFPSAMAPYATFIVIPLGIIVPFFYLGSFLIGALISWKRKRGKQKRAD